MKAPFDRSALSRRSPVLCEECCPRLPATIAETGIAKVLTFRGKSQSKGLRRFHTRPSSVTISPLPIKTFDDQSCPNTSPRTLWP